MNQIQNLIAEKSKLISKADTLKVQGKSEEAKEDYKAAALMDEQIAMELDKKDQHIAKIHWISAISCAMQAEDYINMFKWVEEFEKKENINREERELLKEIILIAISKIKYEKNRIIDQNLEKRILKYTLLRNEEYFQKIRGKGNIIKELYFIKDEMLKFGKASQNDYIVALSPIFSKEISHQIEIYIGNKFLNRNSDNTLNLNYKIRKKLENEKDIKDKIIINNFSEEFLKKINEIIFKLGKLTSSELKKYEREKGITSYQYGREL